MPRGAYTAKKQVAPEEPEDPGLSVLDILTDGQRLHVIYYDGEPLYFIPLTVAQEQEIQQLYPDDKPHVYVKRVLVKALQYIVSNDIYNVSDLFPEYNDTLSIGANVDALFGLLKDSDIESLYLLINSYLVNRMTNIKELFTSHGEEFHGASKRSGMPRKPNPLDEYCSSYMSFNKGPIGLNDVANMTIIQYMFYALCNSEVNIRNANDHEYMMKQKK